jgi:hypothetical protein
MGVLCVGKYHSTGLRRSVAVAMSNKFEDSGANSVLDGLSCCRTDCNGLTGPP